MSRFFFLVLFTISNQLESELTIFPWKAVIHFSNKSHEHVMKNYLCEKKSNFTKCSCSDDCFDSGDCCIDQFWGRFYPKNITLYVDTFLQKRNYSYTASPMCTPVIPDWYRVQLGYSEDSVRKDQMVMDCNISSQRYFTEEAILCKESFFWKEFLQPVKDVLHIYYNSYCALCNSVNTYHYVDYAVYCDYENETLSESISNMKQNSSSCFLKFFEDSLSISSFEFSYSTLFDLNIACTQDEMFNIFTRSCQSIVCNSGYTLHRKSCVRVDSITTTISNTSSSHLKCILKSDTVYLHIQASNNSYYEVVWLNISLNGTLDFPLSTPTAIDGRRFLSFQVRLSVLESFLSNVTQLTWPENFNLFYCSSELMLDNSVKKTEQGRDFTRMFYDGRLCAKTKLLNNYNLTANCVVVTPNETVEFSNYISYLTISKADVKMNVMTCDQFYLHSDCRLHELKEFEIANDSTLKSSMLKKDLQPPNYILYNENVAVCYASLFQPALSWKNVIILITSSISIVVIILLLFKLKRDALPQLDTYGLCISILLTDILVLLVSILKNIPAIFSSPACYILVVLLHWSSLTIHVFALIMGFDLVKNVFTLKGRATKKKHSFWIHCFVAILVPALIVTAAIVFEYMKNQHSSYIDECWLSSYKIRLYFLIIPSIFFSIASTICIAVSCFMIHHVKCRNTSVMAKAQKNQYQCGIVALKLVLLFGVVELFGLFQIVKDTLSENERMYNDVIAFMYSLVRSLRGVFIGAIKYEKNIRGCFARRTIKKNIFTSGSTSTGTLDVS